MRALNKLINRFEWSLKNKKPIYPNETDIHCLNELSDFFSVNKIDTTLEDSFILFWILCHWRVEVNNQKLELKEEKRGFLTISGIDVIFNNLINVFQSKDYVINEIIEDLKLSQYTKGEKINSKEIRDYLENIIFQVKANCYPINELNKIKHDQALRYKSAKPSGRTD